MRQFEVYSPTSFDEASDLLVEHDAKPIAGGSAVITLMKEDMLASQPMVNLRSLEADHSYVRDTDGELRIGALTTLRDIETHDLVRSRIPLVSDCISQVASIRVRNAATLGGHLAHADPDLDIPPVLAGLEASVVVHGQDGERTVRLTDFIKGFYDTDLNAGELIKEILIPIPTDREGVYFKHRSLSEVDWPCVGVAAFLEDAEAAIPEVFMNSVAATPIYEVTGIEDVVEGDLDAEAATRIGDLAKEQSEPVADGRGTEWYKREMAKEFTIRAVRSVAGITPTIPAEGGV